MAFSISDFKKTTRRTSDGRQLYPYQIRDQRYTASIAYAIAYYERMLGRRRGDFEADTLLEFFGDPRLARGLVACLSRTYAWRSLSFAEALGKAASDALRRAGVETPADLRARWYRLANECYGGFVLPDERAEALAALCERLVTRELTEVAAGGKVVQKPPLTPAEIEQGLTLDAEGRQVLVKIGQMPEPEEIVARYNYHSLETALCNAELLRLQLKGPVWSIIRSSHALARRYRLRYEVSGSPRSLFDEQVELTLHGARDGMGSWMRTGRRLVRALLRLLANHPDCLVDGEAKVHLRSEALTLRLDGRALAVLGVGDGVEVASHESWDEDDAEALRRAWGRAYVAGRTAGWRLRRDPEPLVAMTASAEGAGLKGVVGKTAVPVLVVPDFALVRGREQVALCLASGQAMATALLRDIGRLGRRSGVVAVVPAHVAEGLRSCPAPLATYEERPGEAVPRVVAALERAHPRREAEAPTPWQRLERLVAEEGFVPEEKAAEMLGCRPDETARTVQRWGGAGLHALAGVGVCAPELVDEIRELVEAGVPALRVA
ncbi:MAG: hypothetical protein RLZZ387_1666 [Chloroflexota bacterium]|jgi:predicted nuclease of restriction endonuclease-like RecB superfamily